MLQNVLSFYGGAPYGLDWVKHSTGAMAEHFAVFESVSCVSRTPAILPLPGVHSSRAGEHSGRMGVRSA